MQPENPTTKSLGHPTASRRATSMYTVKKFSRYTSRLVAGHRIAL